MFYVRLAQMETEDQLFRSQMARAIRRTLSSPRILSTKKRLNLILDRLERHSFDELEKEQIHQKATTIRRYLDADEIGAAKHELAVTLVSDEEKSAVEALGVWVEKNMYGRKYMGTERATFLIDSEGKIAQIWRKVKVPGHVEAVLEAAKAL